MWLYFLFLGFVLSQNSQSAERPKLPEPGWDLELTGGKSPREFFKARMDQPACREKLEGQRSAYVTAKEALSKKVAESASAADIDKQEKTMNSARDAWVRGVSECGPCTARDTKKDIISGGVLKKEVWYTSHGSCQLSENSSEKVASYFEKWRDTLLHARQYANKRGGFYYIIDLLLFDPATGKLAGTTDAQGVFTPTDVIETSPVQAVISVRGPVVVFPTGFSYYAEQKFESRVKDGTEEFFMNGTTVPPPAGYQEPVFEDVLASGKKVKITQTKVGNVLSQWYVTADGYVRYFTAGDFRAELSYVEQQSKIIMLDTILGMVEKVESNPR